MRYKGQVEDAWCIQYILTFVESSYICNIYIHTYIQELKEGRKEKRSEGTVFEFEHLESVRVQVYMNTQL